MQNQRPPIVAVLGHVDHGKTTLLDAIRKTRVAAKEAGGITQSIGASTVADKNGNEITFIDTPGHAAFNAMRSRGANIADIALLVVAADDGVKPQTKEALDFIKQAATKMVVVLTKTDLATAQPEVAIGQLEKEQVAFEGRGGDTPLIKVSAKEGKGLTELLELIVLVAEIQEVAADSAGSLEALVIETNKDNRGPLVSLVVKNGTLKVGSMVYGEGISTKVRGLFDATGQSVKEILPGYPALVLGFTQLPVVGSLITDIERGPAKVSKAVATKKDSELSIILKAKSAGSLEALVANIPKEVAVLTSSVGEVNESDIMFAKDSGSLIFVFESKVASQVKRLADNDGVAIYEFAIIYELIDKLSEILEGARERILGKAKILQSFPFDNKQVAGGKVSNGVIAKNKVLVVMRSEEEIGRVKIISLKKQKVDVPQVAQGEEFGVIFVPQLAFQVGDVLLSVEN